MSLVAAWFWTVKCGGAACESGGGVCVLPKEDKAVSHLKYLWLCHYCVIHPLSNV